MNESFLHYIWQFQYFDKTNLETQQGEQVSIFKTGWLNTNAGPDFLGAKIRIGDLDWVGNVEIHQKASDWIAHSHTLDKAYENVILHVVWEGDELIKRMDGSVIPTIELRGRVEASLLKNYKKLVNSATAVPCEKSFPSVGELIKLSMLEKSLLQRLEHKATDVQRLLQANGGDWQETTYQLLAKNFGFKTNSEPFFQLAKSLPYKITAKHSSSLLQLEALLFGQAGMLETKTKDEYITSLFQEYSFLSQKYSIHERRLNSSQWKFLRLRPANFPTLRIAQFASLIASSKSLFSTFIETDSYQSLQTVLSISPSDYWRSHFHFAGRSKTEVHLFGQTSKENVIINTIVPLLVAYGRTKDDQRYVDRAMDILQHIPAEVNKVTKTWTALGMSIKSSFDSQALIEQYNNLCQKRNCLNCVVGVSLLRPQ
jgi:Protein of unknown function (DUF2851)